MKGIREIKVNGEIVEAIKVQPSGSKVDVVITMG
jgi:hypothetical protein